MTAPAVEMTSPRALHEAVLAAHAADDRLALAALYGKAADELEAGGQEAAACFYFTQAYVFALEAGLPDADRYRAALAQRGRI